MPAELNKFLSHRLIDNEVCFRTLKDLKDIKSGTRIHLKVDEPSTNSIGELSLTPESTSELQSSGALAPERSKNQSNSLPAAQLAMQFDIGVVSFAGAMLAFVSVFLGCFVFGYRGGDLITILDLSLISAFIALLIYFVCALFPIWLGGSALVFQAFSGMFVGQAVVQTVCYELAIDPQTVVLLQAVLSVFFTFIFGLLPAVALPLYSAVMESSRFRRTIGAMTSDREVADLKGEKITFKRALRKAVIQSFFLFLYPAAVASGRSYRDQKTAFEQMTGTMMVKKKERLQDEISKSKNSVKVRYRAFQELEGLLGKDLQTVVPKVMRKIDVPFRRALHANWALLVVATGVFILTLSQAPHQAILGALVGNPHSQSYDQVARLWLTPTWIFLQWFVSIFGLAFMGYLGLAFCRPTHVELTDEGMRIIFNHMPIFMQDKVSKWFNIKSISLEQPAGKASVADHRLVFHLNDGKKIRLRLGSIGSVAGKEEVLKAVERWAPTTPRSAAVVSALQPPCDYSYTELWMEALIAPPKREKLKPLIDGAVLRDQQFTVLSMLGVGGQGTAYLAQDAISPEHVVLKEFLLPVYVEVSVRRQALEVFEKEARLLKSLAHPNVVKLVDYFVEDHRAYLVLEHIDGESLRALVAKNGPMDEEQVRNLANQMCAILDYLHSQSPSVVHRDFTPDNLILRKDGTLKLIDFNVAHQSEVSSVLSSVVGKPNYLPPEQFRGSPTTQSDIYALGGCLQFLLTGEDPIAILSSNPSATRSDISEQLSMIVQKATEPELKNRFVSASEISGLLQPQSNGVEVA